MPGVRDAKLDGWLRRRRVGRLRRRGAPGDPPTVATRRERYRTAGSTARRSTARDPAAGTGRGRRGLTRQRRNQPYAGCAEQTAYRYGDASARFAAAHVPERDNRT